MKRKKLHEYSQTINNLFQKEMFGSKGREVMNNVKETGE